MTEHEHLVRQWDILPPNKLGVTVNILGCGAIGSWLALALVKMGVTRLRLFDFDKVSIENMNSQGFMKTQIGMPKVDALNQIIHMFSGIYVETFNEAWEGQPLSGIVVSAVDSMSVRKAIWEHVKDNPRVDYLIDPRTASEYAMTFVMNPGDMADQSSYEKTLYTDENAVQEPCTSKATMYTCGLVSNYLAKHVKDIIMEQPYARITHWDIKMNNLLSWGKPTKQSGLQT